MNYQSRCGGSYAYGFCGAKILFFETAVQVGVESETCQADHEVSHFGPLPSLVDSLSPWEVGDRGLPGG